MTVSENKYQFNGIVTKLKLIKAENPTLAYIELQRDNGETLHALTAHKPLTFLMEVQEGDQILVYGHFNHKQQFIIEKYLNTTKKQTPMFEPPPHLRYPPKHKG